MKENKEQMYEILTKLTADIESDEQSFVENLSIASSVLHLTLYYMENGETIAREVFEKHTDGYNCLFEAKNNRDIVKWMKQFMHILDYLDDTECQDAKKELIHAVEKYVQLHPCEPISLSRVADEVNISPGYLSTLFAKYRKCRFTEYVNYVKVEKAKK